MNARSYTFSHAIVRRPGRDIVNGLRAVDTGAPDLDLFELHHDDYIAALKSTGAEVIVLEPLDWFPDAVFVEDAALCLREGAVALRPGAPSRLGEVAAIVPVLSRFYTEVHRIQGSGHVDGGDILTTETEILVGLSSRTDQAGIEELDGIVGQWGYRLRVVHTPSEILHFKTDCALLDEDTVLCTERLASTGCFDGYRVILATPGEEACANAVRFNELVLMPSGFPATARVLKDAGYAVRSIGNSEAAKLDGGMSCLSLRFTPG